ncbi:MAG: valine--tRNA ligase [Candidatus Aenigmarchaeota archaeon]|nr:valine--tRNA ligase [Candidatus Aenigmarchaeota archaeon]
MEFKPVIEEKRWNPELERVVWQEWQSKKIFKFNLNTNKKIFVIDTPPPYPSGRPWHIGAAAHYSQIDMIARTARMKGFEVFFPIGIDRNGLPVEIYTEKKYGISIHKTPREEFIKLCQTALDDLEAEMIGIMKTMGLSGDFDNYYRTDSEEYRKLTQATFIILWKKGLIYEATRPNNYCPVCKTTIADAEVEYKEFPTQLVYIKFKVKETGEDLVIATTRPELLCSCQAVIVNPQDERYKHLHGKHAIIPIYEREVPIIPHPSAKMEFGTGAVMICSYGDYTDVMLFRELGLKEIIAIDVDGKMTENAGKYAGLSIQEARKKIIEDLEKAGLVVKKEQIMHRTPTCERSKNPIEIIPMKEYYLKQLDFKEKMLKLAKKIKFHPEAHRQLLINWIKSITIDWPISRRRVYGTEIPVWYCKKCGKPNVPEPGKYYRPWKEDPPFKKCQHCGAEEGFVGDTRTFDTWVDSSISPLFITGFLRDDELFKKTYPTSIRPQAKDIIRTWLYYTLLRCYQLTEKIPWEHAWIMGYGVDEKGEKMSKSKGNVIDPFPVLEKYGADAFRFWAASEATLGSDFRCSEQRIQNALKFLTKLWNVARFISSFPIVEEKPELTASDEWILSEVNKLIDACMEGYDDFNFYIPANRLREFVWNVFASHYIEMVKKRAYGEGFSEEEQKAAWYTLHQVLKTVLLLFAPIIPFMTDFVWKKLYGKESIHLQTFPGKFDVKDYTELTEKLIEFNSKVWGEKKARNLSLKDEIEVEVPEELKPFEKDLVAMHNIKA